MPSIQDWIESRARGAGLGPRATQVVEIISAQPRMASYASATDLAEQAGVNVATVTRTAQGLGFSGWPEFRLELRGRYLASLSATQVLSEHERGTGDPAFAALQHDIENLQTLAGSLDHALVHRVADVLYGARRTVALGSGAFAGPALQLVHAGAIMGHDMVLGSPGGTALVNQLRQLGSDDLLVVFSFWWLPGEILEAARVAHERETTVCVLTDRRTSSLAELADHLIIVPSEGTSLFPSLVGPLAVVNAVLAELTRLGGRSTREAVRGTEEMWRRLGIFEDRGA